MRTALFIAIPFLLLINFAVAQTCGTAADKDCNSQVNITELTDYINIWYGCSSCAPDLLGVISAYYSGQVGVTIIYVSLSGNDGNPGTPDSPLLTLEAARDRIRAIKNSAGLPERGIEVRIREGVYFRNKSFVLTGEDSGTEGKPIVYRSYPDEAATISGGMVLDPQNYSWEQLDHNGNIIYRTNVGSLRFNSLFVDDRRAVRAKEPDRGYCQIAGVDPETSMIAFNFSDGDIDGRWHDFKNVEIISIRSYIQTRLRLNYTNGNKVYVSQTANNGFDWPPWIGIDEKVYYVENVFEGLDEPGEWYLDDGTGDLYYYPIDSRDPVLSVIIIPVLGHENSAGDKANGLLLYLDGAQYVNIQGIIFAHTDWSLPAGGYKGWANAWFLEIAGEDIPLRKGVQPAVGFFKADHSGFFNNTVKHTGGNAINIYSHHLQIIGNEFYDIGANGIRAGTWEPGIWRYLDNLTGDNIITDNKVHDVGVVFEEAAGIFVLVNGNNTVSHNLVYDVPNLGISVGWGWSYKETICKNNTIEKNEIFNFSRVFSDSGAIYLTGNQPGTTIIGNRVHGGGTSGIYLDEGTANVVAKDNIIYDAGAEIFFHLSSNNSVENNIFAQARWTHLEMSGGGNNSLSRNIFFSDSANHLFKNFGLDVSSSDYNVFHNPSGWASPDDLGHWKALRSFENHSIEEDPLFADAADDNYYLQPRSPAFILGFRQIDMSDVGPRTSCNDCDRNDACFGLSYRDHRCSGEKCVYTEYPGDLRCYQCTPGEIRACMIEGSKGLCSAGASSCQPYGAWSGCIQNYTAMPEACNDSFDNDCDGMTDCDDSDCRSYCESQIPQDYLSWWKFENDASDQKGANNGTLNGNATIDSDPVRASVLSLDGAGDYVSTADFSWSPAAKPAFTISLWANPSTILTSSGSIIGKYEGYEWVLCRRSVDGLGGVNNDIRFSYYNYAGVTGIDAFYTNVWPAANQWAHIAVVGDLSIPLVQIYVNGVHGGTDGTSIAGTLRNITASALIGRSSFFGDWNGSIDDVMIYARALPASEVRQIFDGQR